MVWTHQGVWIPAGVARSITRPGRVATRSVYLDRDAAAGIKMPALSRSPNGTRYRRSVVSGSWNEQAHIHAAVQASHRPDILCLAASPVISAIPARVRSRPCSDNASAMRRISIAEKRPVLHALFKAELRIACEESLRAIVRMTASCRRKRTANYFEKRCCVLRGEVLLVHSLRGAGIHWMPPDGFHL